MLKLVRAPADHDISIDQADDSLLTWGWLAVSVSIEGKAGVEVSGCRAVQSAAGRTMD